MVALVEAVAVAKAGSHASVVMAVVAIAVAGGEQLESSGVWGRGGNDGSRGNENDKG